MKPFKGIIHVHSDFSYDGQHSLEEIAQFGREREYSFIGMSEHSNTFNKNKMLAYIKKCSMLSCPDLIMIPGIEFKCENNLHIIGLGIESFSVSEDPIEIIQFIQKQNGVAIIAHPSRYNYKIPFELINRADGIEVWNVVYDGRFVPNNCSLNLVRKSRKNNISILAFGGLDLHRIAKQINVEITLYSEELKSDSLIHALKEGCFRISNSYFNFGSRDDIKWMQLAEIYLLRHMYISARKIRNLIQGG
jgi:predicted metal-dependent phosphoesterase TrpH